MPFTFSHPAAIMPFRLLPKRWTSLTGLVIGSTAPDFEYFIRMKGISRFSHSWVGILWFDLPISIALAFIYHFMVRNAFIDNLPAFFKKRFEYAKSFDWTAYFKKHFGIVVVCILIGACTHVLWDGLTHKRGVFVHKNSWFDQAFTLFGYILPRYKVLQHVSTVAGGLAILLVISKMPAVEIRKSTRSILPYWFTVVTIGLTVTIIRMFFLTDWSNYANILVTMVSGGLIGMIVAPLLVKSDE